MTRPSCLAVLLLLCGSAGAVPPGGGDRSEGAAEEVRRTRSEAREAYERRREARREALDRAARSPGPAPGSAVPGWRDVPAPGSDEGEPPAAPVRRWGLLLTMVVAGALLAFPLLRIAIPFLFPHRLRRRRNAELRDDPEEHSPQMILLRPFSERTAPPSRRPASDG